MEHERDHGVDKVERVKELVERPMEHTVAAFLVSTTSGEEIEEHYKGHY